MSAWFGSGKSAGGGGGGAEDITGKKNEQQPIKSNNKQQFPVVVQLDEQVLLQDFVNRKKSNNKTSASDENATPLLIGSIDQGTSSTRFLVFTSTTGKICCSAQMEHKQIVFINQHDKVGWHEHDPMEIFENTKTCIQAVQDALRQCKYASFIFSSSSMNATSSSASSGESTTSSGGGSTTTSNTAATGTGGKNAPTLAAVGLTNQRETTVAWNKVTGIPYYNAIVWDDTRTTGIADHIANGDVDRLRPQTGLPLASYFAGTKVKWLLDHVPQLAQDLAHVDRQKQVAFGTIDSWLIYQLTGKPVTAVAAASDKATAINAGGQHVTDVTNASRWLFMDLKSLKWEKDLIATVCHPHEAQPIWQAMPKICPSSHVFTVLSSATSNIPDLLDQVPLAAVLGDQQAALFGQCAFSPGQAKNTYGTGLFLMMNTGTKPIPSRHGLLTTVAYQMDDPRDYHNGGESSSSDEENGQPVVYYALEGSVSHSGSTIQWLRDQLRIIDKASDSETLARTTTHNDGMYFVPAFAGLFAPHWRSDARACMVGMTTTHHAGHVCRAALEAAAYQTREVLQAIQADSQVQLKQLNVDGGATHNRLLMQFQADMANCPVVKPAVLETTALGAAFCAGLAVGVWTSLDQVQEVARQAVGVEIFHPKMPMEEREKYWQGWQKAISKSLGWVDEHESADDMGSKQGGGGGGARDDSLDFQDAIEQEDDDGAAPHVPRAGNGSDSGLFFSTTTLVLVTAVASVLGFFLGRGRGSTRRFG